MWARILGLAATFLIAFALQATVAPHLTIAGAPPDFVLVVVVVLGLLRGARGGALSGLAAGFALDVLRGREIGLFALGLAAAGGLAGVISEKLYPSRISVRFAIALAATVVDQVTIVGLYALTRGNLDLLATGLELAARQAIYNGVLTVLAYGPLGRAARAREDLYP